MPGKHYVEEEFKDIVKLHGIDGKTFEEIVPILKEKYGQDRTVRALQVIYSDRKNKYPDVIIPVKEKKEKAAKKAKTQPAEEQATQTASPEEAA